MPTKKPLKPEKIVEADVLAACKEMGLDVSVYDSKAVYSEKRRCYMKNPHVEEGHPDLAGNNQNGVACYIELKAVRKLRTVTPLQLAFLRRKIESGCFAVVVDSADLLFQHYLAWRQQGQQYLLEQLQKLG